MEPPDLHNIAKSEQQHMDSLKVLLDKYGIPDPAAGKKPGEFTNQKLQGLYAELVQKGSNPSAMPSQSVLKWKNWTLPIWRKLYRRQHRMILILFTKTF